MKKERILRLCAALLLFLLILGAWLFYLRYEGVTKYQYVLSPSPDLSLTAEDAIEIIREEESDTVTAEHLSQVLMYKTQIPISVVRVLFRQAPENWMSTRVSVFSNNVETESLQRRKIGDSEVLFTFPQMESDAVQLTVHDADDIELIEIYENGIYVDKAKEVPHRLNTGIAVLLAALFVMVWLAADVNLLKGKGLAVPVMYFVLEWSVLSFCLQTRSYEAYSYGVEIAACLVFALATLALCIVYRMLFVWHSPMHWVYAISGIIMGIVMMILIQPYTVPDEQTHFLQAYMRSNRMLERADENLRVIRWEDLRFQEKQLGLYGEANSYERYVSTAADLKRMNEAEEIKRFEGSEIQSVPLGYAVTSAAIAIARMLNLSGIALFYLGRFMNLLVFVMLITLAIYLIPIGKAAVMCIAAAPVSMQLAASYSYDPIVTAFAFLYVAYVLRLWAQKQDISLRQYMLCLGLAMLLAPSKIAYVPMTATVFLIPKEKYAFGGKYKWLINVSVVAASFILLFIMQKRTIGAAAQTETIQINETAVQGYTILYLLTHIKETISIYLHTLQVHLDLFVEYLFCGQLGWHQLDAYGWLTTLFCMIFFIGSQRMKNEPQVCCTPYVRWGLLGIIVITAAITMLSMLLVFTPFGSYAISGVQGRYFIPFTILLIPILRNMQIQITEQTNRWCVFAALWASLLAAISLLQVMPA